MSLDECMEKHTHRQYLTWLAWLEMQWNKPDRHDHYLMRVAQVVCKQPRELDFYKIEFVSIEVADEVPKSGLTSKQIWFAGLGIKMPEEYNG